MRAIQKELGERDEFKNEIQELEDALAKKKLPDEVKTRAEKEVRKLKMMSPMSAEATVVRNYVDWILALPWNEYKEEKQDIVAAEEVLDQDHFGLEKPKERILEYLAVQALVDKMKGPILCLVGPPGVGKTSLGRSIARATDRDFVRVSLGGVRDEAEIRGHRRTYIRRASRQSHPESSQSRIEQPRLLARRSRQDVDGFSRGPVIGIARGAGSRAEPHL